MKLNTKLTIYMHRMNSLIFMSYGNFCEHLTDYLFDIHVHDIIGKGIHSAIDGYDWYPDRITHRCTLIYSLFTWGHFKNVYRSIQLNI